MDDFNRNWITEESLNVIPEYEKGVLTVRGLYYQLVTKGMTNSDQHYKRTVAALGVARRKEAVEYDSFSDHERTPLGRTDCSTTSVDDAVSSAMFSIRAQMNNYSKNFWENQPNFIEVWIEKKALQGVFSPICNSFGVALCACKGYPSLTFLDEAAQRFKRAKAEGKNPVILYFGDYDATGLDIPRKIRVSLPEDFGIDVEVRQVCLNKAQVLKWNLPAALSKESDSRTKKFKEDGGIGQVELDAVNPHKLQRICKFAIKKQICKVARRELLEIEKVERMEYIERMELYIKELASEL